MCIRDRPEPLDDEPPYEPPYEPAIDQDSGSVAEGGDTEPSVSDVPYSREDEERDMAEQARAEEGTADRRDATQVAMDLLAKELGAKPL